MVSTVAKVGRRGTIVAPAGVRSSHGLEEGSQVVVEERPEGLLLRPVVMLPVEIYPFESKAEFQLNNTVSEAGHKGDIKAMEKIGIDPESNQHKRPWKS